MKIKVKIGEIEKSKIERWQEFEIVEELPNVGEIEEVSPEYDGEKTTVVEVREFWIANDNQRDEVYKYNYYRVKKLLEKLNDDDVWEFYDDWYEYIAIERPEDPNEGEAQ